MEEFKGFVVCHTKLPTYLAELLQKQEDIVLIYCKKAVAEPIFPAVESLSISTNSTLNLTGSPLEVDLSVLPSVNGFSVNWNPEEAHHAPMNIQSARSFINDYNKNPMNAKKSEAVYCVLDGADQYDTVVLGSQLDEGTNVRTLVFTQGCLKDTDLEHNMDSMKRTHIENVGTRSPKIEIKITCLCELYGYKLKSEHIPEDLENTGSVLVEGSWNSLEYNIPHNRATLRLLLQVIAGHRNSIMYNFFQELLFIQRCINLLNNTKAALDDSEISLDPQETVELSKRIYDCLQEANVMRKFSAAPTNIQDAIQHLEENSFMDKLWGILKCCEKVGDLHSCLSTLFEEVTVVSRLQMSADDKVSILGKMIGDVYAGTRDVPYLSSKQSLQLLIELGIQKLKKNYFFFLKSFDFAIGEQLLQDWNEIGSSLMQPKRGTLADINLSRCLCQLQFLSHIHLLLEFLQLVEQNWCFPKHVSLSIIKNAYNKYIKESSALKTSSVLEAKKIYDLAVPLSSEDVKLSKVCPFSKWQLKMKTSEKHSSVVTIFHYSKKPIFPDTVYKYQGDANLSTAAEDEKFFVTRLECYSDKILN